MSRDFTVQFPGVKLYQYRKETSSDWTQSSTLNVIRGARVVKRPDVIRRPVTAGFRQPTPWKVDDSAYTSWNGTVMCRYNGVGGYQRVRYEGDLVGVLPDLPSTWSLPSSNDLRMTEVKALLKAKDAQYNLSVIFAETAETVKTVAKTASELFMAYRAVRSGNAKAAAKHLGVKLKREPFGRTASERWLELQYGWMPLLGDLHDVYEGLRAPLQRDGMILGVKATTRRLLDDFVKMSQANGTQPCYKEQGVERTVVALWYRVDSEAIRLAAQTGLVDPASVAWEVTPWSFLVDWFIPIGNWLDALQTPAGLFFLGGSNTRVVEVQRLGYCYPTSHEDYQGLEAEAGSWRREFHMVRSTYDTSPIPKPYYKNPLSVSHASNAVALLRTLK